MKTSRSDSLAEEVLRSLERAALVNASRHNGRAEVGAVVSKVIGEFPTLKEKARLVSENAAKIVKSVNALNPSQQAALLETRYPEALSTAKTKEGREGLPDLPAAVPGSVVLRMPPEPSGFMHIGHAMAFTINHEYKLRYGGRLWLRFEDTNPKKVDPRYYENFRQGIRWLGIDWDEEKSVSSDLDRIYESGTALIRAGSAYACSCDAARVKKLRFVGEACEHRETSVEANLTTWEGMISRKYKDGEWVIRLKGEMSSLDTSLRDPNIFRIISHEHPLTGSRHVVWPTYDFEVVVEDQICGVTHVLRSSEFHVGLQNLLRRLLLFRQVTVTQFSRFNFRGTPVAKRLLRPLVEKGLVQGWDDPRMPTISAVQRRGILPAAIRRFTVQVGYTKAEHEYDWNLLFAVNRKLLDPISKRVFFVPRPVRLTVENAPEKTVTLLYHPEKDLGSRLVQVSKEFFVPGDDIDELKGGDTFRMIELYNVKLVSKGKDEAKAEYSGEGIMEGMKKLQWATADSRPIEVLEPGPLYDDAGNFNTNSLVATSGVAERAFDNLAEGTIVQFPRFGFCRVDSDGVCILAHR